MPSIRPCERSKSVHKAYETSPVNFATERHSTHSLPRRLSYNGRISTTCPTACGNSTKSFRGTGVCSKLSKVTVNTIPSDRVFGVRSKLCQYDLESPKGQNKESPSKLSTSTRQPSNFGSGVVKIPGPTIFVNSGSISCPTALLLPPTSQEFCPEKTEILRSSGQPRFRGPSGGSVVEKQSCCMEREGPTPTSDRPNNRNRCIPPGVGGPLPRSVNRGEMVATREHTSHKLPRAPSRVLSSQMFYQIQGKSPGTPAYGQCHSGNLHKQNGGHPLSPSVSTSQESVGLVSQSQCIALSPVYSRDTEHTGRPRVEGIPRLQRLETEPNCFQQPVSEMGTSRHRPFRIPPDISIRPLCELETRPFGNTYGCVHPQLGDISGLCISPLRNDRSVPTTNPEPESRAPCAGGTSLANPSLVSPFTGTVHRFPSSTANSRRSVDPEGQESPSSSTPASWVATINSGYQTTGISHQTREIPLAAWRRNTTSSYSSAWNKWRSWCAERLTINPLSPSMNNILDFFTAQFHEGREYRTIKGRIHHPT